MAASPRLFAAHVRPASWQEFEAEGFDAPVSGVVFGGNPRPTCGVPLGGLDTGCIDVEANGTLGFSTIFNELVHPRHQINCPFLGLSVGGATTLLASDTKAKRFAPVNPNSFTPSAAGGDYTPSFVEMAGLAGPGVRTVDAIDYFGHYPVVDMEYAAAHLPLSVGLRAFTPFVLGDTPGSMVPAAVFDVHLRNPSASTQAGTLAFSFPGMPSAPGVAAPTRQRLSAGGLDGVCVERSGGGQGDEWAMGYVLALVSGDGEPAGPSAVRVGGSLDANGQAWAAIDKTLPTPAATQSGATVAARFEVAAGGQQRLRFVLAWHAPHSAQRAPRRR